jgi:hypothetical protein
VLAEATLYKLNFPCERGGHCSCFQGGILCFEVGSYVFLFFVMFPSSHMKLTSALITS